MSGEIILDAVTNKRLKMMAPAYYVQDIEEPRKLSNYIQLPVPTLQTLRSYLNRKPGETVQEFAPERFINFNERRN